MSELRLAFVPGLAPGSRAWVGPSCVRKFHMRALDRSEVGSKSEKPEKDGKEMGEGSGL